MGPRTGKRWWLAAILFFGLAAAYYVDRNPIEIDRVEAEQPGRPPVSAEFASVQLWVDHGRIEAAAREQKLSRFDFSYAWLGPLEDELGAVRCVDVAALGAADAAQLLAQEGLQLVVLSRSAANTEFLIDELRAWLSRGGAVIAELPQGQRAESFGFHWGEATPAHRLDRVRHAPPYAPAAWTESLPVLSPRWPATRVPPEAESFLWLDGQPCAWRAVQGRGSLVVLGVDLGRWLSGLWQGVPREDFSVEGTRGSGGREQFLQPNDMMADPERQFAWVPRGDLLWRTVLRATTRTTALVRLSPVPAGSRGLFVMTHDEESFGDRSTFMSDELARRGVASTFYVIPDRITLAGTSAMLEAGCEVQLHWNRGFWRRQVKRFGIGPWQPLLREMNLAEQVDALRARLPAEAPPIVSNRNHGLLWDPHHTRSLRIMEAQGFELDSTYGPDEELFGYVFDTGRPYRPIDTNGYPFELIEAPFPFQDDENYHPSWQTRLLEESAAGYRSVLMPIFHTPTMQWNPAAFRMRGWLDSFELAPSLGHPVVSVGQYLEFRRARLASRLRPRHFALPMGGSGPQFVVDADLRDDSQALELPAGLLGAGERLLVSVDGESFHEIEAQSWGWYQIPVTAGQHRIQLSYRPAEED